MTRPSTLVVVHTCGAKGLDGAQLQRQAGLPFAAVLPSPEKVAYPHGSLTEAYIYKLGRPDDTLKPLTALDSAHLRSFRDSIHKARSQGGRVHVVGVLDGDAPVGSRRALESLLRQTRGLGLSLVIHPAVWHATPKEQHYALRELQTLLTPGETELGSVFDIHSGNGSSVSARFKQGIPEQAGLNPSDVVVIANHDMHGLHAFADHLQDEYGVVVTALDHESTPSPKVLDSLSRHKYVTSAVNRPSYERAYFGTITHPYYESLYHPRATQLLQMLVSPHFSHKPHHLFVGVDADRSPEFSSLLRSVLQKQTDRDVVCCLVDPHGIDSSVVLANIPLEHNGSVYHHLHGVMR